MVNNKPHTLYICYFGLREPLVQTQVLPYLREIQKSGVKISLLTFEPDFKGKWTAQQIEAQRKKLACENINWHCLAYHKRPSVPATAFDVLCGAYFTWKIIRREKIDVLHARIHVPMMMAALARKFSRRKPKIIFDIRGFFPEEYTDAGIWKENSLIYRLTKRVERWLMREADGFVVLTEKARQILFPESKETGFDKFNRSVEVIPCCVDFTRFETANEISRNEMRRKLNLENRFVAVYVGAFSGWYMTNEMMDFMGAAREQDKSTFALILTQSNPEMVSTLLKERNFMEKDFLIKKVSPSDIPLYLSASDAAISFIKVCYSKQSSSPTKIPEYLAAGLPVISNSGIGDTDKMLSENKVGVMLNEFSKENYNEALTKIDALLKAENLSEQCRRTAQKNFDLGSVGGERYRRLYRKLLQT